MYCYMHHSGSTSLSCSDVSCRIDATDCCLNVLVFPNELANVNKKKPSVFIPFSAKPLKTEREHPPVRHVNSSDPRTIHSCADSPLKCAVQ